MKARRRTSHHTQQGLFSTAGAMVALVAVAAMMTSSAVASPVAGASEARQTITEAAKVRAAVAAVAAVARTFVKGERLVHALPAEWIDGLAIIEVGGAFDRDDRTFAPPVPSLRENLLDLPPPTA